MLVMVLVSPSTISAQTTPDGGNNTFYLELFGNGGLFSVNYEREILSVVRLRIGYGAWTTDSFFNDAETSVWTIPLTLQATRGRGSHHIEFGGGVVFGHREREQLSGASGAFTSLTGIAGYRYQRPGRGFVFRATATPFYGFGEENIAYPDPGFFPSFGVSFGYGF